MIRILVAMEREAEAFGLPCTVIGIGAKELPETTEDDILVNIGYCGAVGFSPGTIVEPDEAAEYGTAESRRLNTHFDCDHAACFTAEKFVCEPCNMDKSVYDMELSKITALPHKKLYCLKIVSDNLDEAACESFNDENAWDRVRLLLKNKNLIGKGIKRS